MSEMMSPVLLTVGGGNTGLYCRERTARVTILAPRAVGSIPKWEKACFSLPPNPPFTNSSVGRSQPATTLHSLGTTICRMCFVGPDAVATPRLGYSRGLGGSVSPPYSRPSIPVISSTNTEDQGRFLPRR
ncbi:unnamed protein product [Hapterophycus canaliculatus]